MAKNDDTEPSFKERVARILEARGSSPACALSHALQQLELVTAAIESGFPLDDEDVVQALVEVAGLVAVVRDEIARGEDADRQMRAQTLAPTVGVNARPAKALRRA